MDEKQLQALANELAKNLKTPEDLSQFDRLLKKLSVEAALNAEMTHHLGYEKNQSRPGANSRNGYSTKTVITGDGPLELRTPRDRDGTFEPQLVKKNQTRITGMDNQILSLYAKGMTTREIAAAFKELYDADVSPALISKVTDAVMEQVVEWQNRPLDAVYPIVYLDCIVLKVRGFAPIFPDICYHLTHYKPAAADIPVASDNPAHYADAIRYNARTPLQGSLLPLTRLVWA